MQARHLISATMLILTSLTAGAVAAGSGDVIEAYVLMANATDQPTAPKPFSEQEAKLWILNSGYEQVSGLEIVSPGVYQGTAISQGDTYDVVIDAAGNVLGVKE